MDELHFQVMGVIKDLERLKGLFDLFAAVLDRLDQQLRAALRLRSHVSP